MSRRALPLSPLLTHAAAWALGWGLFTGAALFLASPSGSGSSGGGTPVSPKAKVAPRDAAAAATWSAADILREVDREVADAAADPIASSAGPDELARLRADLAKQGIGIRTAFEKALDAAITGSEESTDGGSDVFFSPAHLNDLLTLLSQDQDPLSLVPYLGKIQPFDNTVMRAIAGAFSRDATADHLARLKEAIPPGIWSSGADGILTAWPVERRDELVKWALSQDQPYLLARAVRHDKSAAWLLKTADDPALPADFRAELRSDPWMNQQILADPTLPVEIRVAARTANRPAGRESHVARNLAWDDVVGAMQGPVDWSYRFQTGQSTPAEVLAAVARETPVMAATHPGELRDALYSKLAETDPQRALTLLDGLPADQKTGTLLTAAVAGYDGAPDKLLTLLGSVPDTPAGRDQRLLVWERRSADYLTSQPSVFPRWIMEEMPAGIDRDMALYTTARALQGRDPVRAAEMRGLIADPELQKRSATGR